MEKQRILVTVKTYPTLSTKYGETVCTAGVREDGTWVRIYPVPFRRLEEEQQYSKFDWIECRLAKNDKDPRPESYRPVDEAELSPVGRIDTKANWRERRRIVLGQCRVFDRLEELIAGAKANELSLAVFKPTRIHDFLWEEDTPVWDPQKLEEMRALYAQHDLFEDNSWRETFKLIPKQPYKFSYKFEDAAGRVSKLQVLDWEVGALYANCLRDANRDESVALQKVKQMYLDTFLKKDLHFFLGTTLEWHFRGTNPWVIIGVFPIPHENQLGLF